MAHEAWRDVRGFEGLYEVSDLGRVRIKEHWVDVHLKSGKVYRRHRNQRLMSIAKNTNGYRQVTLTKDGVAHQIRVHRLVMETFVGPSTLEVNHINEDKTDNRLVNLEYLTQRENTRYSCARAVECYDLKTGETIKWYRAMDDAEADGHDSGAISNVCLKKKGFLTHHGLGWRFASGVNKARNRRTSNGALLQ